MAALAPFGTDSQPNTRAILKGGKLMYVPSYTSQREKSEKLMHEYEGDVPFYPPSVREEIGQPLWVKRSPLPPISGKLPNGPFRMREKERSDGHYMDGVKWKPEKINSNADMSQAIQVKRLLEDWPREYLKKIYLAVAENFDRGLTDQVYRGDLASVCIACKLPLTARVLEKLFDRFSLVRDPNNVDYKKLLIYLDTVFEIAEYKKRPVGGSVAEPFAFPLPAPSQQAALENGALAQTFREVQNKSSNGQLLTEKIDQSTSTWNQNVQNRDHHADKIRDRNDLNQFPVTEEYEVAREDNRNTEAPHTHFTEQNEFPHNQNGHQQQNEDPREKPMSPKPSTPQKNTKMDSEDAELLTLLVSHLSKKGRNISLDQIKKAFYDADTQKTTFLSRRKVKDILRKNSVSLDEWLLDAFLNRCDIDNTGYNSCWISIVEFLERVQPFTLKKAPLSPTNQNAPPSNIPLQDHAVPTEALNQNNYYSEQVNSYDPQDSNNLGNGGSANRMLYSRHVGDQLQREENYAGFEDRPPPDYRIGQEQINGGGRGTTEDMQSRIQNLTRALKSVDIDQTGYVVSEEALRLLRNYNTVYQLGMDEFDLMRLVHNSSHNGQVVVDSLCDSLRIENSLHY